MPILSWIDDIGKKFLGVFVYTARVFEMIYLSFRASLFYDVQGFRTIFSVICSQVYFTGFQALPLVSVIAMAAGAAVVMQSTSQLNILGGVQMIGQLMVVLVVRELAPLLTALIVIARSGTAVASELGNMRVNREIEALEVMGINPLSFIVFPRLVGGIVSVLVLALYFVYAALFGGFVFAKSFLNMPLSFYAESITNVFTIEDVVLFAVKNIFSGAIIFTVCCHQGLLVRQGPHEVPQVTTKAVMNSLIYVVLFNLTVTVVYYLSRMIHLGLLQ
jgi:phospholipid/cholesterol/gamma-HCH transport system permease protein